MKSRYIVEQYKSADVTVTICRPGPVPKKSTWRSRHLGKSDSAVARATGRYNHA